MCQEDTVFLVSFMSSGLYNIYASFSAEFPELRKGGFDKDFAFRTECPRISLILTHCPAMDLCINSHILQEEASLMVNKMVVIYSYSRMSLGVILITVFL